MSWLIVADSSCNLRTFETNSEQIAYSFVPLKIHVGSKEFVDDENLDIDELNRAVALEQAASSSACPSAGEWAEKFRLADNIIAITISGTLSGSFEAAQLAKNMICEESTDSDGICGKRVYIHDSKSAGPKLELLTEAIIRYLEDNPSARFDDVVSFMQHIDSRMQIIFSLSHYDNLVKSGRFPRVAGNIASKLNIRLLGTASDQGTIKVTGTSRGDKKTYRKIIDLMVADGYHGGHVNIDHMDNLSGAQTLSDLITERWPQAKVCILPCDGLCSYYAEQTGLIIGYEWID